MLTPPKRQSRAIIADSLFPKDRKKQETQDITLEPAGTGRESGVSPPETEPSHHPPCPIDWCCVQPRMRLLFQGTQKEGFLLVPSLLYNFLLLNNISTNYFFNISYGPNNLMLYVP